MGLQAERAPTVSRRIRSKRLLLGFSIALAVLWGGQTPPILSRINGVKLGVVTFELHERCFPWTTEDELRTLVDERPSSTPRPGWEAGDAT